MNARSKLTDVFAFGWPCVILIILNLKGKIRGPLYAQRHARTSGRIRGNIKNRIPVQSYGNISQLRLPLCDCVRAQVHVVGLIWGLSLMGLF